MCIRDSLQDFPVGGFDETVEPCFPVLHGHGNLPLGHVFGDIEVGVDEAGELRHLRFGQVVFGDADIEFLDFSMGRVFPCAQALSLIHI